MQPPSVQTRALAALVDLVDVGGERLRPHLDAPHAITLHRLERAEHVGDLRLQREDHGVDPDRVRAEQDEHVREARDRRAEVGARRAVPRLPKRPAADADQAIDEQRAAVAVADRADDRVDLVPLAVGRHDRAALDRRDRIADQLGVLGRERRVVRVRHDRALAAEPVARRELLAQQRIAHLAAQVRAARSPRSARSARCGRGSRRRTPHRSRTAGCAARPAPAERACRAGARPTRPVGRHAGRPTGACAGRRAAARPPAGSAGRTALPPGRCRSPRRARLRANGHGPSGPSGSGAR